MSKIYPVGLILALSFIVLGRETCQAEPSTPTLFKGRGEK